MNLQKIAKKISILLLCVVVVGESGTAVSYAAEASSSGSIYIVDEDGDEEYEDSDDLEYDEDDSDDWEDDSDEDSDVDTGEIEITERPSKPVKPIKPGQTNGLVAQAVKNGIKLTWKKTARAQKYEIYRKKAQSGTYKKIKTVKNRTYTDQTAKYGVTYRYRVRAIASANGKTYTGKYSQSQKMLTYRIDPKKPMVALTFDDGPSQYTPRILDSLQKNEGHATFFEMGNRVGSYPKTVKRIYQMGCEIGSHSYDHPVLGNASVSTITSQLSRTDNNIKKLTGTAPALFRPPYGSVGTNLRNYAGKPLILWSVDTLDWKYRDSDRVYNHVMSNVRDGDIILMHDLYSSTAGAAERMIPELKKKGYQLVTVSELAQYRKVNLKSGERYSQMRP